MNRSYLSTRLTTFNETDILPVIIVGAGPTGLCGSLLLGRQGIRTLLIERHSGTSTQPKARGINVRTMELLRTWGLEDQVRSAGQPLAGNFLRLWAESLAGKEIRRVEEPIQKRNASSILSSASPTSWCLCMQEDLESIVLAATRYHPLTEIRFDTELVALKQEETGVRVTVLDRTNRMEYVLFTRYLVATDGAHSFVRHLLNIPMNGPGKLNRVLNIDFQANLTHIMATHKLIWCSIRNDTMNGLLLPVNNTDRWLLNINLKPTENPEAWTHDYHMYLIRQAIGKEEGEVTIRSTQSYTLAAGVAQRYQLGHVFLAGDAAHLMPPAGAFGMNTGIQDIHNLIWKIAAVLSGWAHPHLLESYEAERLPVAYTTLTQAFNRLDDMDIGDNKQSPKLTTSSYTDKIEIPGDSRPLNDPTIILGYSYTSHAIMSHHNHTLPMSAEALQQASIGYRAPHLWINRGGQRQSVLDLFHNCYVLLAGPDGSRWLEAGRQIVTEGLIPLLCYGIAPAGDLTDLEGRWETIYGGSKSTAVLVRPDGFIAWICPRSSNSEVAELRTVLMKTLRIARD